MTLNKVKTDLKRYLHNEKEYWRQKSGMKWFSKGDRKIKLFHSHVKERRKRMQIIEIQTIPGDLINTTKNIREEAIKVFKYKFKQDQERKNSEII